MDVNKDGLLIQFVNGMKLKAIARNLYDRVRVPREFSEKEGGIIFHSINGVRPYVVV